MTEAADDCVSVERELSFRPDAEDGDPLKCLTGLRSGEPLNGIMVRWVCNEAFAVSDSTGFIFAFSHLIGYRKSQQEKLFVRRFTSGEPQNNTNTVEMTN